MRSVLSKILLPLAVLAPLSTMAADAMPAKEDTSFNATLLGLVSIVIILMVAIASLAIILKQLAFALNEQRRKEGSAGTGAKTVLLLLLGGLCSLTSYAQGAGEKGTETVTASAPTMINGIPANDFYFLSGVIAFELLLMLVLLFQIASMVRAIRNVPDRRPWLNRILSINLLDYFNKSVAVKDEHTIVLDHDYDGIHELDNSLPPWWKWGFGFTIIFAVVYLWYYQVAGGPDQIAEYTAAVQKAEEEKLAYLAKAGNSVDENTVTLVADPAAISDAKVLFKNTCAACHREDAGGNVGPNLTDAYWLHGGNLKDVFKSIKYGWKDKGMPEWQHNMSAKQIAGIASYVMTLKGKNPPGAKPPQGDLVVESGVPKADSVKAEKPAASKPVTMKTTANSPVIKKG